MSWKETDERLIRRGELILDIESLKDHGQELKKMNKGKRGRSYRIADTYVQLLAVVRYLFSMPYRQLEGYTRILHRLVPDLPQADYSGIRKRILRLNVDPYRGLKETSEPVTIAVDSTGISVQKAGGWVERKHGKKKRYVKLHFAAAHVEDPLPPHFADRSHQRRAIHVLRVVVLPALDEPDEAPGRLVPLLPDYLVHLHPWSNRSVRCHGCYKEFQKHRPGAPGFDEAPAVVAPLIFIIT
jgi:hypothetical protein